MSNRTSEASKAIRKAWQNERDLVSEGLGTRDWTPEQQHSILDKGKAYDADGYAFQGHHMKSAEAFPEYQGDPGNIQFLSKKEHLDAHGGSFHTSTNGYYDPVTHKTTDFGKNKYTPCKMIELSHPISRTFEIDNSEINNNSKNAVEKVSSEQVDNHSDKKGSSPEKVIIEESHKPSNKTFVEKLSNKYSAAKDWLQELPIRHPKLFLGIKVGAAVATAFVTVSSTSSGKDSKRTNTVDNNEEFNNSSDDRKESLNDNSFSSITENETDNNYSDHHASPTEHMVSAHSQRYGKDKHWVKKDAYPRGGKN